MLSCKSVHANLSMQICPRQFVQPCKFGPLFCQKGLENSYSGVFGVKLRSHVLGFLISRAVAEIRGGCAPPMGISMVENFNISRSCRRPSPNRWRYAAEKVLSGVFWGQGTQPGNAFFPISRRRGDVGGAKVGLPLTAMLKSLTPGLGSGLGLLG